MSRAREDAALALARVLPPQNAESNLAALLDLAPDLAEELLSRVDQPLRVARDPVAGRDFLLCDYNRDVDSYRSPWTDAYHPPLPDGDKPPPALRELESHANEVFDAYRAQYHEGGVSSVYLWTLEEDNPAPAPAPASASAPAPASSAPLGRFAGCFLLRKEATGSGSLRRGVWDATHVIEVTPENPQGTRATYALSSSLTLHLAADAAAPSSDTVPATDDGPTSSSLSTTKDASFAAGSGETRLAATVTRRAVRTCDVEGGDEVHVVTFGRMVEETESALRNRLDDVLFGKTREATERLRQSDGARRIEQGTSAMAQLMREMVVEKQTEDQE